MLFPSQEKRNTRDKAQGLCITSERHIGELGVRCLSALNRGQESKATISIWKYGYYCCIFAVASQADEQRMTGFRSRVATKKFHSRFGGVKTLFYLCTRKRNERPSGDAGSLALRDL